MRPLSLIVAQARNHVIGHQGDMPWHYPEDLRFFQRTTRGHCIIMGRGTAEALGKPLPNRRNLLLSRRSDPIPGFELHHHLDAAIAACDHDDEPFIGGGAQIYALAMPVVTRMYITIIPEDPPGDVLFPEPDYQAFTLTSEILGASGCRFQTWDRRDITNDR